MNVTALLKRWEDAANNAEEAALEEGVSESSRLRRAVQSDTLRACIADLRAMQAKERPGAQ